MSIFRTGAYSPDTAHPHTMILSKIISVPKEYCIVCKKHHDSFILNLLMVFNSIDGFPLDNVKDIFKYLSFRDTLRGAVLQYADLWAVDLSSLSSRTDLREADLIGANLWGTDLRGAYLQEAKLQRADLREAYLQGADLRGAKLWEADLRGAKLQGAKLQGADLERADLRGTILSEEQSRIARDSGAFMD